MPVIHVQEVIKFYEARLKWEGVQETPWEGPELPDLLNTTKNQ